EKVRTRQNSIDRVLALVKKHLGDVPVYAAVVHANDLPTAELMLEKVKQVLNLKEVILTELAIPVAANLGPGTIGIAAYPMIGDD
ncbi:MAG: DegV family protein, partial [Anaerolineaceae bacterium]|nr:DegV family protein [Anaerolineaceae bacterium]